jgi:hypothetical protein
MELRAQPRKGILSSTTFPAIFYSILRRKDTGVLTLSCDSIEKLVYVEAGKPVFATSNAEEDRLNQVLIKTRLVSAEGLLGAIDESTRTKKRLGLILVEHRLIKPSDLVQSVLAQVKSIICSLFLWTRGSYRYDPGQLPSKEVNTLSLNADEIIFEGIRRIDNWARIWEAVGGLDARYQLMEVTSDRARALKLSLEEWALLTHCEEPAELRDLLRSSPLNDFEICRLLWALRTVGIVARN